MEKATQCDNPDSHVVSELPSKHSPNSTQSQPQPHCAVNPPEANLRQPEPATSQDNMLTNTRRQPATSQDRLLSDRPISRYNQSPGSEGVTDPDTLSARGQNKAPLRRSRRRRKPPDRLDI